MLSENIPTTIVRILEHKTSQKEGTKGNIRRRNLFKNLFFYLGAGLMGFYRVHMLDVISVEFLIVPLILLVGGFYTFFTAIFGVYATMKEDSCLVSQQKRRKNMWQCYFIELRNIKWYI
jgi:hypothetical protein